MPRTPIPIPHQLTYLSVLDADGQLDSELEPHISEHDLRRLYRELVASRTFDERCLQLQRQGRLGTYGPSTGQEAAALGVAYALDPDDWLVPSFREMVALHWRGWNLVQSLYFWGGHEQGSAPPKGTNTTPNAVPVASQCQYAMGIAWGLKKRRQGAVCAAFVGDGGTSEGDFHEAMNFAGVFDVPLIMVVQNNQWAISLPREKQTASPTIAQKAIAYGFDAIQVDGNDLLAVIVAAKEAVEKARKGGGPTLIEALTYRLACHTSADDPKKYRSEEEVKCWEAKDPIPRFRDYLLKKGIMHEAFENDIRKDIKKEIDAATAEYERCVVESTRFFDHVFAESTEDLVKQKAELDEFRSTPH